MIYPDYAVDGAKCCKAQLRKLRNKATILSKVFRPSKVSIKEEERVNTLHLANMLL